MKASVIIACGGSASRMNGINKLFYELENTPVIIHTARNFDSIDEISEIIFSSSSDNMPLLKKALGDYPLTKPYKIVLGGSTRQQSVFNGVKACEKCDVICVHDGARPFISQDTIKANLYDAKEHGCAIVGVMTKDTVKLAENGIITSTTKRENTFCAQTPQSASYEIYNKCMQNALTNSLDFTDDSQLFEAMGYMPKITQGEYSNIKITTSEDIALANSIVKKEDNTMTFPFRIGHGYDVHKLTEGRKLILGGVEIAHTMGLDGHSDADVLTHAVMDSILGAAAMGDIGRLFPDTDMAYKGADSIELLKAVCQKVYAQGYSIVNIDATICAQAPKISPHYEAMRQNLANACGIDLSEVSVKATTEEGLGFTGEKKGISATAVCMIRK